MKMDWEIRAATLLLYLGVLLATIHQGIADKKIVCYYTNWSIYRPGTAKFSPQNINPYLCTHLIYAFGGFTKDNALRPFDKYQDIEKGGYAKFNGLKTYNKNLKTMLAIGGWNEGSSRFSPMVADPGRRREFVKNSVKFLRQNHFDGLDLDWEYPAFRDGGKPRDKDNYASLVQELREEFDRESSKTGRPRLLLSMAVPAGIEYIDKGYDVPKLNDYLDFINLLSYDYHSAYEPAVNHHSPLYPLEEDNEYNYDTELTIDYTINHLLDMGASSDKIILGIPTYGRSYTLFNEDATDLGSPADGPGIEGDATREKGYLAYYEICENLEASDDWEVVQPNPNAMGPYAFKGNQWVGYDDEEIVRLKAKYVNEKKLGGIMFWSIDNDDFRGKCHDRPYPLIEAAKEALLADSANTVQKSKPLDSRKKSRPQGVQSNAIGRKLSGGRRSTTTQAPVIRKRVTTPRTKYRTITRPRISVEEEEEEDEDKEIDRRSYDSISGEEDEEVSERGNVVKIAEKRERPRPKNKGRAKSRPSSNRNRRKQVRRKEEEKNEESREDSPSNKLTTPEPPTTPDPGTDFKCEDEGFFPHPRDCKKYFWCLDSGPGGLGVVAHQFTCPSGLVFNKAADSCDYPRNVVCPKAKTSQSSASTTRAPITAATSRTTYLYSTTRRATTEKAEPEEEYEYYDDEDDESEEEVVEEKEEPKVSTTSKPLLYKTINRSRPTTTATTTTTTTTTTTSKPQRDETEKEKVVLGEDEEDPRVIKELIDLIKKAGGIEQLEKQLLFQEKNSDTATNNERVTPATISRTLYERVLSRQANKIAAQRPTPSKTNFANGPGGAQFEGLDEVPEVKSLRRTYKHQYVNIERPKASTREPPVDDEEVEEDQDETDVDNTDVASSEEKTVSNQFLTSSTQRATPSYVNIRRTRPSTTTSRVQNDAEEKNEEPEEDAPPRRRRPANSKNTENDKSTEDSSELDSHVTGSEDVTPTTKSRYVNVQRFRSTTTRTPEDAPTESAASSPIQESTTEVSASTKTSNLVDESKPLSSTSSPISFSTSIIVSTSVDSNHEILPESVSTIATLPEVNATTESVKLVEESATEILLTTAPASSSQTVTSVSVGRITAGTVSQPRPFGFTRRTRPTTSEVASTSPLPLSSNDQTRSKVATTETMRLPTLKELIRYQSNDYANARSSVYLKLFPPDASNDIEAILSQSHDESNLFAGENSANSVLEEADLRISDGSDDTNEERDDGVSTKISKIKGKGFSFGGDDVNLNDVRDNVNNVDEDSSTNEEGRIRIDRSDDSLTTTTLRPTTMRGPPLVKLLSSQAPRGFYVTKSDLDDTASTKTNLGKVDNDALLTTTSRMEIVEESGVEEEGSSLYGGTTTRESVIKNKSARELPENTKKYSTTDTTWDADKSVRRGTQKAHRGALKFSKAPTTDRVINTSRSRGRTRSRGRNRSATRSPNSSVPEDLSTNVAPGTTESILLKKSTQQAFSRISKESTSPISTSFDASVNLSDSTTTVAALSDSTITIAPSMEFETTTAVLERKFLITTVKDSNTEFPTTTAASGTEFSNTDAVSTTEFLTTTVSLIKNASATTPGSPNEFESTIILTSTENFEQTLDPTDPITEVPVVPTTFAQKEYSESDNIKTTNAVKEYISDKDENPTTFVQKEYSESDSIKNTSTAKEYITDKDENPKSVEVVTTPIVDQDLQTTTLLSESPPTIAEAAVTKTEETNGNVNKSRRRHKIRINPSQDEFGEKNVRRGNTNRRVVHRPSNWGQENRKKEIRRRVTIYRGRKRTNDALLNNSENNTRGRQRAKTKSESEELGRTTIAPDLRSSTVKINNEESLDGAETDNAKRLVSKEFDAKEETAGEDLRDPLRIEEYSDKPVTEVTPPRTLGGPLSTRLRKPASSTLSPNNGLTNSLVHQQNIRPTDATAFSTEETLDTTEGKTETPKPDKDLDQSSRAQEVAVTLAVPPTSESSGRVPLKETLRRRISTTLSPRSDFTTSRTPLRLTTVVRNRPKARAQDRILQNVTTRPRRPPVRDYDYYEDEEERIVGKSSYNGKLFLTSKGTVRCLDQGNFPHPYSCKKFITCARMVNGQVIGAEYTCPDKLSFDPVGGICNWSAGLGCNE